MQDLKRSTNQSSVGSKIISLAKLTNCSQLSNLSQIYLLFLIFNVFETSTRIKGVRIAFTIIPPIFKDRQTDFDKMLTGVSPFDRMSWRPEFLHSVNSKIFGEKLDKLCKHNDDNGNNVDNSVTDNDNNDDDDNGNDDDNDDDVSSFCKLCVRVHGVAEELRPRLDNFQLHSNLFKP